MTSASTNQNHPNIVDVSEFISNVRTIGYDYSYLYLIAYAVFDENDNMQDLIFNICENNPDFSKDVEAIKTEFGTIVHQTTFSPKIAMVILHPELAKAVELAALIFDKADVSGIRYSALIATNGVSWEDVIFDCRNEVDLTMVTNFQFEKLLGNIAEPEETIY